MIKYFLTLLILTTQPALGCEAQSHLNLAKSITNEINLIRQHPLRYVQLAQAQWNSSTQLKSAAAALCKGHDKAQVEFYKAMILLKKQSPLEPYKKNSTLNRVACDIVADMAQGNRVNPLNENYDSFFRTQLNFKEYKQGASIASAMTNPRDIVVRFLIGDCQFKDSQGTTFTTNNIFWKNIFSKNFRQSGAACDHHPLTQFDGPKVMCAFTVLKKGGVIKVESGYQKGFEEL